MVRPVNLHKVCCISLNDAELAHILLHNSEHTGQDPCEGPWSLLHISPLHQNCLLYLKLLMYHMLQIIYSHNDSSYCRKIPLYYHVSALEISITLTFCPGICWQAVLSGSKHRIALKLKAEAWKEGEIHFHKRASSAWVVNTQAPLESQLFSPRWKKQKMWRGSEMQRESRKESEDSMRWQHHEEGEGQGVPFKMTWSPCGCKPEPHPERWVLWSTT